MASAVGEIGGIGLSIIKNIGMAAAVIVFAVALFYLSKFVQKNTKKQKAFTINAKIYDLNGSVESDMMAFFKSDIHGMYEMQFKKRKQDTCPPIPKHLIKNNVVALLNYAPGHYCVLDTTAMAKHFEDTGELIYIPFNLHMKQYIKARQRDVLNKQVERQRFWKEYAPWITLGAAILLSCTAAFLIIYFGGEIHASNIAARFAECKAVMK